MSRQRNTCRITNQPAECTGPRPKQPRPPGNRRELPKFRQTLLHQPEENEGNEQAMAKGGGIPPYVRHTHGVACKDEENGECRQRPPGKIHRHAWSKNQCGRGLQGENVHVRITSFPVAGRGHPLISGKSFSVASPLGKASCRERE